jgi:hypothetical protein
MRRRLGASGLLALLLTVVLVAPTFATRPFLFKELRDICTLSGGLHGFGYVKYKVRVKELGTSGANYFRIRSKVQYRDENGAGWFTLKAWDWVYSPSFPNNSNDHAFDLGRRFDPDGTPDATAHRIWMRVQVWSNSSGLLAEQIMTGQKCVTGLP